MNRTEDREGCVRWGKVGMAPQKCLVMVLVRNNSERKRLTGEGSERKKHRHT